MPAGIYFRSDEYKENQREVAKKQNRMPPSRKGCIPWNKGKKIEESSGDGNYMWKGDKVGYVALHAWLVRMFGKAEDMGCMFCAGTRKSKRIEWANLSGNYRRDPSDWTTLCAKCHRNFDRTIHSEKYVQHK